MGSDPEDVEQRLAATVRRSRELAAQVSELAGAIADTEEGVADQLDRVAENAPDRAQALGAQAEHARSFAEEERDEQRRWRRVAQEGPA